MKTYMKLLSIILLSVIVFSCVSICSAGAESTFVAPEQFIYGDVDMDGEVTIKDTSLIQKGLAGISYLTAVQRFLATSGTTDLTVRNATLIQKHLAGLEPISFIGEFVDMQYTNAFSQKMGSVKNYFIDCIIVSVKDTNWEYTLADFPEYPFSDIYVNRVINNSDSVITEYVLRIPEYSRKNLEAAITALDYRANLDLYDVTKSELFLD